MNGERSLALVLVGALLVLVAGWALAIGHFGVACPASASHLACTALVRPAARSLGSLRVAPFFAFGAGLELLSALLLDVLASPEGLARLAGFSPELEAYRAILDAAR